MKTNKEITHEELVNKLIYFPETGTFIWRDSQKIAGSTDNKGYRRISLNNVRYKSHRLAWFYVYKTWPNHQIDHIDGNKLNNAINNLRDVVQEVNMYNKKQAHKSNSTNTLGVSRSGNKYVARLRIGNTLLHLGSYLTADEAHNAYLKKKLEIIHELTTPSLD